MEENYTKCSIKDLEKCTYRYLQQMAKAYSLPSNVKKIYLIQLIYAKIHCTDAEVNSIIQRVRLERQQLANNNKRKCIRKKMHLQGMEVSSTNNTSSPPINVTPKRPTYVICTPSSKLSQYKPPSTQEMVKIRGSDRVLRSYNLKTYKRPNYSNIVNNSIIDLFESQRDEIDCMNMVRVVRKDDRYPKIDLTEQSLIKKHRPSILSGSGLKTERKLVPLVKKTKNCMLVSKSYDEPISKMYSSKATQSTPRNKIEYMQSIGFRHKDGKMSKINALVQKPKCMYKNQIEEPQKFNTEVTIQDIINSNIDAQTFTNPSSEYATNSNHIYPNMSSLTDVAPTQNLQIAAYEENNTLNTESTDTFTVYCHKKIRAEQIKQRVMQNEQSHTRNDILPKINDVFSNFNNISRDVIEPLYIQVSENAERTQPTPPQLPPPDISMLETIYNFRSQLITNPPLVQVTTKENTRCVFATPICVTSAVHPTAAVCDNPYQLISLQRDNQQPIANMPSVTCDLLRLAEQEITLRRYHEAMNSSTSSLEPDMELASIPEMVEDALELISQDGDYMERIGMDVRVQCILCSWAGPQIILEIHIKNEHMTEIHHLPRSFWNVTFALGSLTAQSLWHSVVSSLGGALYALSATTDKSWLDVTIASISPITVRKHGTITIYNKVTGEPYTWKGDIQSLPYNMPYSNNNPGLRVELSRLQLLPNSTNLQMRDLRGHPVLEARSKAIVGTFQLHDVQIIVFVTINNMEYEI